MNIGLLGFPQTGKTTLFNTLTGAGAATGPGAGRPETHRGIARVPDDRLDRLAAMFDPKKLTHATVEYVDPAGVKKGEGRSADAFLADLRQADALAHVVRAFEDEAILHSQGAIDPKSDVETMEMELILADHTVATKRAEKIESTIRKTGRDDEKRELELIRGCIEALEKETPLREMDHGEEDARILRGFTFLTAKPLLVVLNAGEDRTADLDGVVSGSGLDAFAAKKNVRVCAASAKIESEIAGLEPGDARAFMDDMGLAEPALTRILRNSYELLGVISFFTVGEDECRAWTIRDGTPARRAAGAVHSDIERGFIRAEVVGWQELLDAGSLSAARDKGILRLEGKDYTVHDGEVVHFRFSV